MENLAQGNADAHQGGGGVEEAKSEVAGEGGERASDTVTQGGGGRVELGVEAWTVLSASRYKAEEPAVASRRMVFIVLFCVVL